jgi:SAM-dependent methyltransferase
MGLKYKIDIPLDSPERTILHKEFIEKKFFLNKLYKQWYAEFKAELNNLPEGKLIELGSGSGFIKDIDSRILTSDILDLPTNDMTFSALEMPFEDNSVAGIFLIDTMHHIPDAEKFLDEVQRVLKPNGKMIMVEPANSFFGRLIYQNFHHEPFNPQGDWSIPFTGPLSGANGCLPWIVFERDYEIFKKKFPSLQLTQLQYRNPLLYLLSGGVSFKQLLPNFMYKPVALIDRLLPKIWKGFSMFQLIKVVKK